MKILLIGSLFVGIAFLFTSCASHPPRTASGRELKLEVIRRPHMAPVYQYRPAN